MVAGTVSRNPTPYHANERDIDNVKFSGNPDDDSVGTEPTVASSVKTEASYNDFLSFVGSSSAEKASQKEIAEPKQFSRTLTASTADCTVGDVDESSDSSASNIRGSVNERREQPSPTNIENSNTLTKDEEQKKTPESVIPETENFDQTKKAELLKGASIATLHFATEETRKEVERVKAINIAKQAAKEKSKSVEPLPADYFTKQNEARLEAEKQAALDGLKDAPIAVRKMTLRGFEEKEAALKAQQEMSTQQRSAATSHFQKKQEEAANKAASTESNVMPVAIQKFTVAAREEKQKRQAEIEALKTNKNDQMPAAQSYFTEKAKEDKAKRDAENQRLKESPAMTAAGAHFAKVEEQKKAELEKLRENPEPMPAGQAYFTNKAREERNQTVEGCEKVSADESASKYLAKLKIEEQRLAELQKTE
ncbi:hypothetical protein THAOC_15978 [Thalassiosira oceanica]|uniref:Uncharacterized protein n=1 Tax=Thalassiosira oceanica TaxID=159749 RepID=K0SB61_THAOC|nr:hypothetical protein THAOC_15978 [Thalassiosira oceanica]|eukprot:EJK63363.1 hypothetical protein THAOC_15978 [Thalassiosira oceanica]